MNAKMRFLLKKLQHFPFHTCILEAKFCRTIGLVIFIFSRTSTDLVWTTVKRPLRLSSECSSVHMLLPICAYYPLKINSLLNFSQFTLVNSPSIQFRTTTCVTLLPDKFAPLLNIGVIESKQSMFVEVCM